jgi:hypothetical protein
MESFNHEEKRERKWKAARGLSENFSIRKMGRWEHYSAKLL